MRPSRSLVRFLLALALVGAAPLLAQEEPLAAGSEGVPLPKKVKHVQPIYPQEALAQGVRGIVILDVVVDAQGKVESTSIVRSVPGLDEAAVAAARQWQYEPIKVNGQPVRVRLTVPITFALALPKLSRMDGVPELRQGATPAWPSGASGGGLATAEVTLEPDGRVGAARVIEGGAPWSEALLGALRTWRFSPPPDDEVVSFRVEAEFAPARGSEPQRVSLKTSGVQRSSLLAETPVPAVAPAAAGPTAAGPATDPPAAVAAPTPPTPESPGPPTPAPPEAAEPKAPATALAASDPPKSPVSVETVGGAGVPPPVGSSTPSTPAAAAEPAPPPVEVLSAPPPAQPPENGVSAVRDVTLGAGVPDLARGRRPVAPPLARMAGVSGTVEISFSVSAGGTTSVQGSSGPELLRLGAEQAVASWVFRRARADRAYLVAVFTYAGDKVTVVVSPQASPNPALPPASPSPSPDPPSSALPLR